MATEPNRTEPNRTEPNRTEPNRTEPNRTEIIHEEENNYIKNKIIRLKSLFPEVFCEEKIDFEKLKLILGADNLADAGERYQLNWAGKTAAYLNLQSPTSNTLAPCREESVDFDGTQNVFIEAENLEALKILQKAYAGSVKMIYIDPPYNTGNDSFIYPDKFSESREEYARRVGDTDDTGYLKRDGVFQGAWRKNGKDNGHYHSNWLSMMLPRLHLAKTLLSDDGVIFISIDDNEQAQLKLLCDEVFGAENFVADFIWNNKYTVSNDTDVSYQHEHIICYTKNRVEFELDLLPRTEKQDQSYKNRDDDPKGAWKATPIHARSGTVSSLYEITFPNGITWSAPQGRYPRYSKQRLLELFYENSLYFNKNGGVDKKTYLSEVRNGVTCGTLWSYEDVGHSHGNNEALAEIVGKGVFSDPKGTDLILRILQISTQSKKDNNCIVLDFFSGSGTTAHAVMLKNHLDSGNRKFICVQLAEQIEPKEKKAAYDFCQSLGLPENIAEIAKERIRRAGGQISGSLQNGQSVDTGFKVFKLAASGFRQWRQPEHADAESLQRELLLNIDAVLPDTSFENLLYELMLRLGLKLTCKVLYSDGAYRVEDEDTGRLSVFLLERVDQSLIDAVLAAHPAKVVVLDRLFDGNDALKSNTVLQMKDAGVVFECV